MRHCLQRACVSSVIPNRNRKQAPPAVSTFHAHACCVLMKTRAASTMTGRHEMVHIYSPFIMSLSTCMCRILHGVEALCLHHVLQVSITANKGHEDPRGQPALCFYLCHDSVFTCVKSSGGGERKAAPGSEWTLVEEIQELTFTCVRVSHSLRLSSSMSSLCLFVCL